MLEPSDIAAAVRASRSEVSNDDASKKVDPSG
jgi:hypothetical protein